MTGVVVIVVIAVALLVWLRRGTAKSGKGKRASRSSVADLRRRLDKLTHDPEVTESLLRAERGRHPNLGEAAILHEAIRRLRADRRN